MPDDSLDLVRAVIEQAPDAACIVVPNQLEPSIGELCAKAPWLLASLQMAAPGVPIRSGGVYILSRARPLAVLGNEFTAARDRERAGVDGLITALASTRASSTILVLLDGAAQPTYSLRELRARGGLIAAVADADASAKVAAVPSADLILQHGSVAFELGSLMRHLEARLPIDSENDARLERIASSLGTQLGRDAHGFCREKLARQVERRMWIHRLPAPGLYLDALQTDSGEAHALYSDLLACSTEFVCASAALETLKASVLPDLIARAGNGVIHVWVPGCSTGEEAFSLAIVLSECLDETFAACRFEVLATDVDTSALLTARGGVYPRDIERRLTPERLARFFEPLEEGYAVGPELRSAVAFREHDIRRDPPCDNVQLISCRNVLSELSPEAASELVPVLHFALDPGGFLVLGANEGLPKGSSFFRAISASAGVYRPRAVPRRSPPLGRARADRLASLGAFAADMAHELKNPLGSIALSAEYALSTPDPERRTKLLSSIARNAERCGHLVENVLHFARGEALARTSADINWVVQRALDVACSHHGPERLQVSVNLTEPSPRVRCNVTELEQVFVNLLRNAVEAHPGCCHVRLTSAPADRRVKLLFSDDGPGVPASARDKIFEPFYSTKRDEGGTGLGLSISSRVVAAHGGSIRLVSDGSSGATFELEFPCERPGTEEEADNGADLGGR